jgi:hypothetical protein
MKNVQTPQYLVHQIVKTIKSPFKVPLGSNGFEHEINENLKWEEMNTDLLIYDQCEIGYYIT